MKVNFKQIAALAAFNLALIGASAQTSINGTVYFVGGAMLNGPMDTATAFSSFFGPGGSNEPVVLTGTGDYASIPVGTPAQFMPLIFSGPGASITGLGGNTLFDLWHPNNRPVADLVAPFWALTVGGTTYNFDVTSIQVVNQTSSFLNLQGNGLLRITGHADTTGIWTITDTGTGSPTVTFGFQVSAVPEPTVSALVFGLGALLAGCRLNRSRVK